MELLHSVEELRQRRWLHPSRSWGLVPTMGYLHDGHFSLIKRALSENDGVVVSIFVNPTQFGDQGDLENYPRNLEHDVAALAALGVDLVFAPTATEMYPPGFQTTVSLDQVTKPLEGAARPGHFDGVATVVSKLFNIVQPHRTYFGQKDAQQVAVLKQMIHDLNINIDLIVCPTVREADGLAMSSRNARLSGSERQRATVLYQALLRGTQLINAGERDGDLVRQAMLQLIENEPLARADYVSVADATTLQELKHLEGKVLLSLAIFVGPVRLIDNMLSTIGTS